MRSPSKDAIRFILEVLEMLAEGDHEATLTERVYECFFEHRPDAVPLFGEYALSEREEMVQETLRSLLAYCETEPWLESNLKALGSSHAEYGVETPMYPAYVAAFLETLCGILGDDLSADGERHVREALEAVCEVMSKAGSDAI